MSNFKITFLPQNQTISIESNLHSSGIGKTGSILDFAMNAGIDIDHACGGVAACSTCHVIIKEGFDSCNDSSEDEEDQLDRAPGVTIKSRLACQCIPTGNKNLIVEIPNWNRNLVREGNQS